MRCPLCQNQQVEGFVRVQRSKKRPEDWREYFRCSVCHLIFLHPDQRMGPEEEKARYATHNNDPSDLRYEGFLRRLWEPLKSRVSPGESGLDFGCGPTEAMREIAARDGFDLISYDPFFFPNPEVLQNTYDFIYCSEVIEHLYEPGKVFAQLAKLLGPGGRLGLMTGRLEDWSQFKTWGYITDPSHVCFYPLATIDWLSQVYGFEVEQVSLRVHILTKV